MVREGSAPAACAAGLFLIMLVQDRPVAWHLHYVISNLHPHNGAYQCTSPQHSAFTSLIWNSTSLHRLTVYEQVCSSGDNSTIWAGQKHSGSDQFSSSNICQDIADCQNHLKKKRKKKLHIIYMQVKLYIYFLNIQKKSKPNIIYIYFFLYTIV